MLNLSRRYRWYKKGSEPVGSYKGNISYKLIFIAIIPSGHDTRNNNKKSSVYSNCYFYGWLGNLQSFFTEYIFQVHEIYFDIRISFLLSSILAHKIRETRTPDRKQLGFRFLGLLVTVKYATISFVKIECKRIRFP